MSICFWPASKARLLRGVHAQNVFCYHKTIRIFGWKTNSVLSKGRIDFISKKRNVASRQSNLKSGPCLLITELVNVLNDLLVKFQYAKDGVPIFLFWGF
jgi:hypothetical protein